MRRMMMPWCDCVKLLNLLTPSCCPFPRAKAEEELWTHSNEQSEVAQREAPKGPSKNKSWPWQKHRHKPSNWGWPFWRGTHVEQLQESESRPRDVQMKWEKRNTKNANTKMEHRLSGTPLTCHSLCHAFLAKERLFFNGNLPPSFVRLQRLLDALMRTGLEIFKTARRQATKKYREHVKRQSVCFYLFLNEKANQFLDKNYKNCPSQLCLI